MRKEIEERVRGPRTGDVRYEDLPPKTQQALFRSVFGACAKWLVITSPKDAHTVDDPGQRIAVLRTLRRITQRDLAKLAGVRQADVSKAETDFLGAKLGVLQSIAEVLGTTVEELRFPCGGQTEKERSTLKTPSQRDR